MQNLFFVRMGVPMMFGIFCGYQFDGLFTVLVATYTLVLLIAILVASAVFYRRLPTVYVKAELLIFVFGLYFYGGVWLCLYQKSVSGPRPDTQSIYQIRVVDEPQYKTKYIRFKAIIIPTSRPAWPGTPEKIVVTIFHKPEAIPGLRYGDELMLSKPAKMILPPTEAGRFDMQRWMASQHIYRQANITPNDFIIITRGQGNPVLDYALKLRQQQVKRLSLLIKDKEAMAVAVTLILGYRSDLSSSTLNAYTSTGTVHALSVSGMHVGLIYLCLEKILWLMNRRKWTSVIKLLLILSIIWAYAILTGLSPAVLRSALMLTALAAAKSLRKTTSGLNILAFSACLLLVADPFILFDIGFQLSFLSVLGLLVIQPVIRRWVTVKNYIGRQIWDAVALSLAAQLFTFPLALYYFHQFPLYFLLSNLLIAIPVSLVMYLGMLILMLHLDFLAPALEMMITTTNKTLLWISELPFASIRAIWIDIFGMCCLYTAIGLLTLGLMKYRTRLIMLGSICLLLVSANRLQHNFQERRSSYKWRTFAGLKFFYKSIIIK